MASTARSAMARRSASCATPASVMAWIRVLLLLSLLIIVSQLVIIVLMFISYYITLHYADYALYDHVVVCYYISCYNATTLDVCTTCISSC